MKQAAVLPGPFEVSGHVLLFMHGEAAGTTSAALCDPHSADLKEADRCQVYQRATAQAGGAAAGDGISRAPLPGCTCTGCMKFDLRGQRSLRDVVESE